MRLSPRAYFNWLAKSHVLAGFHYSPDEDVNKVFSGSTSIVFQEKVSEELFAHYREFDAYAVTYRQRGQRKVIELNVQNGQQWIRLNFHLAFIIQEDIFITKSVTSIDEDGDVLGILDDTEVSLTSLQKYELQQLVEHTIRFISEMPKFRLYFATGDVQIDQSEVEELCKK